MIKIEPPGGDPGRHRGPVYRKTADPEKSLLWFALNANKQGISLNLESGERRDTLKRLVICTKFPAMSDEEFLELLAMGLFE